MPFILTQLELYTNIRYLMLKDKPRVPEGHYKRSNVEEAISHHWAWMLDTFKVDNILQLHTVVLRKMAPCMNVRPPGLPRVPVEV